MYLLRKLFFAFLLLTAVIFLSGCTQPESIVDYAPPEDYSRPPPTSTPSYPSDISKIVEEEIKKLTLGQILFNPPQKMTAGEKERVVVRVAKNLTKNLSEGLKGRGAPQIENISVGTFMSVRLKGNDFYIESLSPEDQPVSSERITQWDFDVTPLKSGNQSLRLSVTVRIKIHNEPEEKMDIYVLDRQINVRVDPIEDELKKLTLEQILLNTSKEMTVGVTEKVVAHIPRNLIENLSVGPREMEINLTGKNFEIEDRREVHGNEFTEWIYHVTPLKSGDQSLELIVGVKLKFPNGKEEEHKKIFEKTINVKANLINLTQKFIEDNWQWIISTLIGSGVIGLIIKKIRKSRKKK